MEIHVGDKIKLKTLHKIGRHSNTYITNSGWCAFDWTMSHFENLNKEFTVTDIISANLRTRYVVDGRYAYPKEFIVCQ